MKTILLFIVALSLWLQSDTVDCQFNINRNQNFYVDSTYQINVVLIKGAISGFAKFEQTIPFDFEANSIDTGTGNLSSEDGKIKILWRSLPDSDTIRLSYLLKPVKQGKGEIVSKFLYLEGNTRMRKDFKNVSVFAVNQ